MTPNVSLKKSIDFTNLLRSDFLQGLSEVFPSDVLNNYVESNKRDRIYSTENTVLSMIHTATQEDKSLKNSVFIFQNIYQRQCILKKEFFKSEILHELESHPFAPTGCVNKVGRPKTKERVMKKSIDSFPSSNTAAYSKAKYLLRAEMLRYPHVCGTERKRLLPMVLFVKCRIVKNCENHLMLLVKMVK